MKLNLTRSKLSRASLGLVGVLAFTVSALAQNAAGNSTQRADPSAPEKTGVGSPASKTGPSTDPGLAGRGSTSLPASKTGVGSPASKVGPSTQPPASNEK